ncbi:MAG: hypothetical protein ACE5GV_02505 [Candidatus Scalindua sp.]
MMKRQLDYEFLWIADCGLRNKRQEKRSSHPNTLVPPYGAGAKLPGQKAPRTSARSP